jgi:hypothetical protein
MRVKQAVMSGDAPRAWIAQERQPKQVTNRHVIRAGSMSAIDPKRTLVLRAGLSGPSV